MAAVALLRHGAHWSCRSLCSIASWDTNSRQCSRIPSGLPCRFGRGELLLQRCPLSCPASARRTQGRRSPGPARAGLLLPVDPWAPGASIDSQSIASSLFAASLLPYLGFLFFLARSGTAPRVTLFGFYFLLAFVGATIPAGIYAKVHYGTSLSNVDYLHGSAESLLTVTNLLIVLGLRNALSKNKPPEAQDTPKDSATAGEQPATTSSSTSSRIGGESTDIGS